MSDAYLRFWGVRGSYAAPFGTHLRVGGNTSCVELRVGSHVLVCDAGTGIIPLGEAMVSRNESPDLMIVFTHYHWDHICGLPFFTPAFSPLWRIKFFGPGRTGAEIERQLADQMKSPYFPVEIETWMANVQYLAPNPDGFQHGPIALTYHNVHHPGVTYGYRIKTRGLTICYVSDNEFLFLKKSIRERANELSDEERALFERIETEERDLELDFMRGADILIHDAQYTAEDYALKRGWGHSCYIDTVNSAIDAGVRSLYLYHHDPSYRDEVIDGIHRHSLELIERRRSAMECHVAREGMVVEL